MIFIWILVINSSLGNSLYIHTYKGIQSVSQIRTLLACWQQRGGDVMMISVRYFDWNGFSTTLMGMGVSEASYENKVCLLVFRLNYESRVWTCAFFRVMLSSLFVELSGFYHLTWIVSCDFWSESGWDLIGLGTGFKWTANKGLQIESEMQLGNVSRGTRLSDM